MLKHARRAERHVRLTVSRKEATAWSLGWTNVVRDCRVGFTSVFLGIVMLICAAPSWAQDGFSVENFTPAADRQNAYIGTSQANVSGAGTWGLGLLVNYARDPFVLADDNDVVTRRVVGDQLAADLVGSFAFTDWFELGLAVPLFLYQSGESVAVLPEAAATDPPFRVGDIRVSARFQLVEAPAEGESGAVLAFGTWLSLPTGEEQVYQGGELSIEPRFMLDWVFGSAARLGVGLGYRIGPEQNLENISRNDALTASLAGLVPVGASGEWEIVGEFQTEVAMAADELNRFNSPAELRLGARWQASDVVLAELGAGAGVVAGVGSPDYRFYGGVSFGPRGDPDGDGFFGRDDACPMDPEDMDGFEDGDGCSEPDNDGDGIVDMDDGIDGACMNDAEDADGFEDDDGCPDPDNDGDGIPDALDGPEGACMNEAEDFDGFEDSDGCPDADNDGDGITDMQDGPQGACMDDPEDVDGFEDDDGCPEPDNDRDGVLDADDGPDGACMNDPEDLDGFEDDDGCPEEGTGMVALTCRAITINDSVYFDSGSDVIQERSFELLNQVVSVLQRATYIRMVRVEGHTDDVGRDEFNLELSRSRASSVMRYLLAQGVDATRLSSEGFGETMPIAPNNTAAGRADNRRVEFIIVEQDAACAE